MVKTDKLSMWYIPKWSNRRGKIFYIRLMCLIVGIIMLWFFWVNESDTNLMFEVATLFMGLSIGEFVSDALIFSVPCKNLKKENY